MKTSVLIVVAAFGAALPPAAAADSMAAEQKAKTLCAGCHGPTGISVNPLWPNLAGQKADYMVKTLREYQSGKRQDPNMTALAQTLTEAEMSAISAYYAALDPAG